MVIIVNEKPVNSGKIKAKIKIEMLANDDKENIVEIYDINDIFSKLKSNGTKIKVIVLDYRGTESELKNIINKMDMLISKPDIFLFMTNETINIVDCNLENIHFANTNDEIVKSLYCIKKQNKLDEKLHKKYRGWNQDEKFIATNTKRNEKIISVVEESLFAYDLAKSLCEEKSRKNEKVLLVDLNLLNPTLDIIINKKFEDGNIETHMLDIDKSGVNLIIDAKRKNVLNNELIDKLVKTDRNKKNLDVLLGNYNLNNYEYYKWEEFEGILDLLKKIYSKIVLLVSNNMYDSFSLNTILISDSIIFPVSQTSYNIRNTYNKILHLKSKQNLDVGKCSILVYRNSYKNIEYSHLRNVVKNVKIVKVDYQARELVKNDYSTLSETRKYKKMRKRIKRIMEDL